MRNQRIDVEEEEVVSTPIKLGDPILASTDDLDAPTMLPASLKISTDSINKATEIKSAPSSPKTGISFSNNDSVMNYNTKESSSQISSTTSALVSAPKTVERLEKISHERNEQRKLEEAEEEEDEDDFALEKIKIFDNSPKLDALDVQVLDEKLALDEKPILTDIEVLS